MDASIQYLTRNNLPKGRASKKSKNCFFIDALPKPSRYKTRPLRPKMVVIFYAFPLPYQHRIRLVAVLLLALALRATRTSHQNTSKSSLSNIQTFLSYLYQNLLLYIYVCIGLLRFQRLLIYKFLEHSSLCTLSSPSTPSRQK